jgi:hypothetical protein
VLHVRQAAVMPARVVNQEHPSALQRVNIYSESIRQQKLQIQRLDLDRVAALADVRWVSV